MLSWFWQLFGWCVLMLIGVWGTQGDRLTAASPHPPKTRLALGMNLSGPADWNTELPFVDVFRLSRPWISQRQGAPWGKGPPLELDEYGWVKRLEDQCWAETLMCTIEGGHYPSGEYVVLYEGEGELTCSGSGHITSRQPGRLTVQVEAARGPLFLQLRRVNPSNYVRNIHVLLPGFEQSWHTHPFHPQFLQRWRGVACLRFMDWMETNHSPIQRWAERPTELHATFSQRGVPVEWMVALCNELQADAWFCMPHQADDDYVRQFARLVRERLQPPLKVYVEYSNEVWNSQFEQHRYAAEQGQRLHLAEKPWEAAWRYTARRSLEMFRLWQAEFPDASRLVRVLASQAANPYVSEQILTFEQAATQADALAIAPYISFNIPARSEDRLTASVVAHWSLEQLLQYVEDKALPECLGWIRAQRELAHRHGLALIAYEGGQHLVGVGGGENEEALTALLHAANRHPRMETIYARYLLGWEEAGGALFCHFSSVSQWSKWGSWGVLEYADEDPRSSPKCRALIRAAERWGQRWSPQ